MLFNISQGMTINILLCVAACFAADSDSIDKHLALYASFDKSTANADFSKGKAEALLQDEISFVDGKRGLAAMFASPASAIIYSGKDVIPKNGKWTVCMWVKPSDLPSSKSMTLLRLGRGKWKDGDLLASIDRWGKFKLTSFDEHGAYKNTEVASSIFKTNEWIHLAFVCDGVARRIIINGNEAKYLKNDIGITLGSENFMRLGCMQKGEGTFSGAFDELRVYDKALSPEEVKEVMNLHSVSANPRGARSLSSFYASFDGNTAAINLAKPFSPSNSSKVEFIKMGKAKGALLMRFGYDSKSSLLYSNVEGIAGQSAFCSFAMMPRWAGDDNAVHALLEVKPKANGVAWTIIKGADGKLRFTISLQERSWNVAADVKGWRPSETHEICCHYDFTRGIISMSVDDAEAVSAKLPENAFEGDGGLSSLCVGDLLSSVSDMYAKTQADGSISDLMITKDSMAKEGILSERNLQHSVASANEGALPFQEVPANPIEQRKWDVTGAFINQNAFRRELCLNALWRFQPVISREMIDASSWLYLAVPGRYSGDGNSKSDHAFLARDARMQPLPVDFKWNGRILSDYRSAWFERSFDLDKSWKGLTLSLRFEQLSPSENAIVYFNGVELGRLDGTYAQELQIAEAVLKYGEPNFIAVQVNERGEPWAWRGIKGDVWLLGKPDVRVELPQIVTSVENGMLSIKAGVLNDSMEVRSARLVCEVSGRNAPKPFESPLISLKPGERRFVEISTCWKTPELWDFERPYLYDMVLSLTDGDGKAIDRCLPQKFGFREFKIKGGDYLLNGNKVHLVNTDAWLNSTHDYTWCLNFVKLLKGIGYNSFRASFGDEKNVYTDNIIKACDEAGLLVFMNAYGAFRGDFSMWNDPTVREKVERKLSSAVIKWRNHPSVVLWYLSGNQLGYAWDYHPLKQADGYLPSFKNEFADICLETAKLLDKYDGTRTYFMQAGGSYGPIHTSNAYFCWWPLAERMEWPEEWSKRKSKPMHNIETSFPYWRAWFGCDVEYRQAKPYFLPENAARFFGIAAYEKLDPQMLQCLVDPKTKDIRDLVLSLERQAPSLLLKTKSELFENTVLAWRGAGLSGFCPFEELVYGYFRKSKQQSRAAAYYVQVDPEEYRTPGWKPDYLKYAPALDIDPERPTPYLESLKYALNPTLVFIGGDTKRPSGKDHAFHSGERVSKEIVAINDTLLVKEYKIFCRLADSRGNIVASDSFEFAIDPGCIVKKTFVFRIPDLIAPESFKIEIEVASPHGIQPKPFEIQCYPDRARLESVEGLALYDANGYTKELLDGANARYRDLEKLKYLDGVRLVIVGRESLDSKFFSIAKELALKDAILSGKANLLVCEQKSLAPLGLETHEVFARDVFASGARRAKIFDGISEAALSWWTGDGTLAPAHQPPAPETEGTMGMVKSPFWHWTNRNMVCSYPVRRPTAGASRIHLSTGMDLVYSPLLEFQQGLGKIVFCQLEVSGRTKNDPVAEIVFDRLVESLSNPEPCRQLEILALGERCETFAASLGFKTRRVESVPLNGKAHILIAEFKPETLSSLERYATEGKTVVFLPLSAAVAKMAGLKTEVVELRKISTLKEGLPFFGNLDSRDLFFRYLVKATVLFGSDLVPLFEPALASVRQVGKGRLIFLQLDPSVFDEVLKSECSIGINSSNAYAYWLVKERLLQVWTALFTSLGAAPQTLLAERLEVPLVCASHDLRGIWKFSYDPLNEGESQKWPEPSFDDSKWINFQLPGQWGKTLGKDYIGYGWFRRTVELPPELVGRELLFEAAGGIDDFDWVYVNGSLIGHTGEETQGYWKAPRSYRIPAELTTTAKLSLAIRVMNKNLDSGVNPGDFKIAIPKNDLSPFPYFQERRPCYETESHVRW